MKDILFGFLLRVGIFVTLLLNAPLSYAEKPSDIWPTTGWKTSTPEKHGIKSDLLDEMYANKRFTGNLLLVRHGYLVAERYDQKQGKKYSPHIFSCTKGIISALIGIALRQEHLTSIHQKVLDFFPKYERVNRDEQKQQITLYHLLTMTSGLWWTDKFSTRILYYQPDWNRYILEKPIVATPGTSFNYNSGNAHLLSAILQKATKMTTLEYAERHLFEPIGISAVKWERTSNRVYLGGWGVRMALEDMAKFGYLYLQAGKWKEQQVVPAGWITASTQQRVKQSEKSGDFAKWGYGYLWSIPPDMPHASPTLVGGDGKYTYLITVIPDLSIVLVYAGSTHHNEMFHLMRRYLLPAVTP